MLTERFGQALVFAHRKHINQVRKGNDTPYISHLLGVSSIVLENGGTEDEAIAALLHDAIEDQQVTYEEIKELFGSSVADVVLECSDSTSFPKPSWKERKIAYLESIPHKSKSALLVTLADKLHNSRSILIDYQQVGETLWERFTADKDEILWYYRSLVVALSEVCNTPLLDEFRDTIAAIDEVACSRSKRSVL